MNDFNLNDIEALITDDPQPIGNPFLDGRYDEGTKLWGHQNPYYRLFYEIAKLIKPGLVVELGGWQGMAAGHFAAGGARMVVSIDHHSDPGDDVNQAKMLAVVKHHPEVIYLQGWTWNVLPQVRALGKPVDVLFVDSWHMYEYAKRDWDDYSPLLANPSLVIVDDILPDNQATMGGMIRFWEEISAGREAFTDGRPHWGIPMGFIKWTA